MEESIFSRSELLLGPENMKKLREARVILFGVGGVGSWCAESLIRTGLRHLTIVDGDRVCPSNINRQLMATTETIGEVKVDALKRHLLAVSPEAEISALYKIFDEESADDFNLEEYDYVIDCIDSLKDKVLLIRTATDLGVKLYSSMGAALKIDPTKVRVAEFRQVQGCPLARALRQRFKKSGRWPRRKFKCVYSDESAISKRASGMEVGLSPSRQSFQEVGLSPSRQKELSSSRQEKLPNGSLMHITAIFGLTLAGLLLEDLVNT